MGIDPGFSGAIAVLNVLGQIVDVFDMPIIPDSLVNPRPRICGKTVSTILSKVEDPTVVIESVHASPQMGVTSAFRFGEGYGTLGGVFASLNLKVFSVLPTIWKAHFNLDQNKNKSRTLAKKFFPESDKFNRAKDDGRAEAALIAVFGMRKFLKVAKLEDLI